MSFASPVALLALVLVPLVALAYAQAQRRPRYLVRFPGVGTLQGLVAATPAWRRHLPAALLLLALTALLIGLARPQRSVAVAVQQARVMLVTDASGSMRALDVSPDRISAAQGAARRFLDEVPDGLEVGAVSFSDVVQTTEPPSTDHSRTRAVVDGLVADGGTATGDALASALDALRKNPDGGKRPPSAIVLLSDGRRTIGQDPIPVAREAARLRIPIFTVSLGTDEGRVTVPGGQELAVPPDPITMRRVARISGGQTFEVSDADELESIYKGLGSRIGTKREKREITVGFAAGGLLLLLGAAVTRLRWAGRLP
jgi:Ca-activated chloride channel family protein